MRALGPGSVSSFLKIILDVVYYALFIGLGGVGVAMLVGLLLSFNPEEIHKIAGEMKINGATSDAASVIPMIASALIYAALYLGALLAIVSRLRKVFATLTSGDPFHPENIRRLRLIGFVLAGMEIARYGLRAALSMFAPGVAGDVDGFNITTWFAVLVVFVLAEVFREGARLRREAELTI